MKWWGYLHADGSIHLKRYHGATTKLAIAEAEESSFVADIHDPFEAARRDEAMAVLRKKFLAEEERA